MATDHAPHGRPEKQGKFFLKAAFGLVGSELALPIMMALVRAGEDAQRGGRLSQRHPGAGSGGGTLEL